MKHPIGTKVDVWSGDETEHLGSGTIIDYERITTLGETIRIDQATPVIMLTFGNLIRGYECEYDVIK